MPFAKSRLQILLMALLLTFFNTPPVKSEEVPTVTMGALLFSPDIRIDENGVCVGDSIDVSRFILAQHGINMNVVCAPPIRMYRLVQNGEVDFTINIQSTTALKPFVKFVDPPYALLSLNHYKHNVASRAKSIAAIRGFDYNGFRKQFEEQNFEFIDLPTASAALQVFLKKRSASLLSYEATVRFAQINEGAEVPSSVTITPLLQILTHYAIAEKSPNFDLLWIAFHEYAKNHNIKFFRLETKALQQ